MDNGQDLLGGVTVPVVTPMRRPGQPSAEHAADLLASLHDAGVDALMLLGSNGEGPLLPTPVLGEFTHSVVGQWRALGAGRPVLVNVTAAGTGEVRARAEVVAPAGPDALVLSPPTYFHHRDDEIVDHFAAMADLGLPVVAYNAPKYSNPLTPAAFEALLELEHVVGLKDSSADPEQLRWFVTTARARRPGFGISQGDEARLLPALRAGVHGIVPGIANLAPAPAVELVRAYRTGRVADAERAQQVIGELLTLHAIRPGVPAVKAVLDARGLCPPHVAPPLRACTPEERRELLALLAPYEPQLIPPLEDA